MNRTLLGTVLAWACAAASAHATGDVQFNRDVRPILTDNCFHCHGPDPGTRKAGLRLDREATLFGKTDAGGFVVVRGKPDQSELYTRIASTDEDEVMPPPKSHKTISAGDR